MLFNGQTITLGLDTDVTLTGYSGIIKYTKPSGVSGYWEGEITDDTVSYDVQPSDTEAYPGVWYVQARAINDEDENDIKYGKIEVVEFTSHL